MSATPLRELVERATKGPWAVHPIRSGDKWIDILAPAVKVDYDDVNHDEAEANAQLIARLSPDVALRVYEALENLVEASAISEVNAGQLGIKSEWLAAKDALKLLDGSK